MFYNMILSTTLTRLHMSCVVQVSSTPSSFQCFCKLGKYISKISVATDQSTTTVIHLYCNSVS